jgi:hypothetical protein
MRTVTLFFDAPPSPGETREISVGGVGQDGATTYVVEDFQPVTTTVDGSVIVTQSFSVLGTFFFFPDGVPETVSPYLFFQHEDTIQEDSSKFGAYPTQISGPYAAQETCLMSDSSLGCVAIYYSSGSAYTTDTFSASPFYVTSTLPATSAASSSNTPRSNGAIVGGAFVGSVVLVIIVVALLLFYRRRRHAHHIVTVENKKAMRPELASSVMENPLPQAPFYAFRTAIERPERPPRSASIPRPMGTGGDIKSQSTQTEGMALGPSHADLPMSPLPSAPRIGPDREPLAPSVASGGRQDLRPELEVLRAEVERLRQMVTPDDAPPPGYDEISLASVWKETRGHVMNEPVT